MDKNRIAAEVEARRKARGMTQEELAKCAGCSRQQIHNIESAAKDTMMTTTLNSVLQVLGLELGIVVK
jgi:transcriptional regulator with XRE-family HTH domain